MGLAWGVRVVGAEDLDSLWDTKELALRRSEVLAEETDDGTEVSVVVVGPIVFEDGRWVPEERGSDV